MQYYFQISPLRAFHACLPPPDSFPKSGIIATLQTPPACDVIRRQTVEVEDMKRDGRAASMVLDDEARPRRAHLLSLSQKNTENGSVWLSTRRRVYHRNVLFTVIQLSVSYLFICLFVYLFTLVRFMNWILNLM